MFKSKNINVMNYQDLFTMWFYKTTDNILDINNEYFKDANKILNEGDRIIVNQYKDIKKNKGFKATAIYVVKSIEEDGSVPLIVLDMNIIGDIDIKGKIKEECVNC